MSYQDEIVKIVEEGGNVDSIYLDFANAFDKQECSVLFHRLRNLRIYGKNYHETHDIIIVTWVNIFHRSLFCWVAISPIFNFAKYALMKFRFFAYYTVDFLLIIQIIFRSFFSILIQCFYNVFLNCFLVLLANYWIIYISFLMAKRINSCRFDNNLNFFRCDGLL